MRSRHARRQIMDLLFVDRQGAPKAAASEPRAAIGRN
jgi:hypothetical protein